MLLPHRCAVCGASGHVLCPACAEGLPPAGRVPTPAGLDRCLALLAYDGSARPLVLALKHGNQRAVARVAGPALAGLVDPLPAGCVVTWAPTSARRRRRRGFDQAAVLARAVAAALGLPCQPLLVRLPGPTQTGRSAVARRTGPQFRLARRAVPPAVVLVDDVVTTGATLAAAAAALRSGGARRIDGLLLAATPAPRMVAPRANLKEAAGSAEVVQERAGEFWIGSMQPTNVQVQRSLAALRAGEVDPTGTTESSTAEVEVPEGLLDDLGRTPPIRPDRLAEAKGRLAQGEQPSPDELANRIVGRLVCDRLR